jgi:hypothetical protein
MAEAEQRLFRADMTGGLATVAAERQRREHQYPLPSFDASVQREEERRTFNSFLEDAERDRREHASEENRRATGWFPAAGPMTVVLGRPTLHRHHHRAHREPTPPAGTPTKTTSFSLFYILPYYVKTIFISIKSM